MSNFEQERLEYAKHQDALMNIRGLLQTKEGQKFVKYLFESLGVGELPEIGVTGEMMHERLGLTRAAQSVFSLISQANAEIAARLLAEIEREKHERNKPDTAAE